MKTPHNTFKHALQHGPTQIGLWVALANAYSTELVAGLGYDWLLIDGEHAPNDVRSTLSQLQAVASAQHAFADEGAARSQPVVRVPVGVGHVGTTLIKQYLDIGAQTLMVPMIDTAEQAAQVVAATRYAPAGVRGMGAALGRASRWMAHERYVHEADAQICVIAQVESVQGLANLDAIAGTDGVDAVFIGPADLAASMGHPGNVAHPAVQAAIEDAVTRIQRAGKAAGIIAVQPDAAQRWIDRGCRFVAVGSDTALLASAGTALRQRFTS